MLSKPHLAPELLEQIFHLLPRDTCLVCLSVCKSWHVTAKQVYFSQIQVLSKTNPYKLISSLQTTGHFVRSLTVEANILLIQLVLTHLITSCPSLLHLRLNTAHFEWVWLSNIKLNRLKSVAIGDVSWRLCRNNKFFYRVAYQHRDSLEYLHIPCSCDQILQQEFSGIMEYLSHFENLKHLKLINGSQSVPVYFDSLLDACTTLDTLIIELGHPLYSPTTVSTKPKTVYKSMSQLQIFLTMFSIEYLQYIMDRFVNITILDICINQGTLDWERDRQEICYFMQHKYLPFINTLSQSSLTIKMNGTSTMGDLSTQFCSVINEITNVRFQIDRGTYERTDIKLKTENGNTNLNFLFVRDLQEGELPYIKHLEKYGNSIKSLELDISRSVPLPQLAFDFIVYHCRNLENIYINIEQKYPEQLLPTFQIANATHHYGLYTTVLNITISGGMISPNIIRFISSQLQNLKTLHLIKCSFLLDRKKTVFDMSKLNFLDSIVLDAQYVHKPSCQYTCFILTKVHYDSHGYYLLDHVTGVLCKQKDNRIPSNTRTITFIFNNPINMEIYTGLTTRRRDTNSLITFP